MPTLTFRREGGFPRQTPYGGAITCSYSEVFTLTAPTMEQLWRDAEAAGKYKGGSLLVSGIDNRVSDWQQAFPGEPINPSHTFRDYQPIKPPTSSEETLPPADGARTAAEPQQQSSRVPRTGDQGLLGRLLAALRSAWR